MRRSNWLAAFLVFTACAIGGRARADDLAKLVGDWEGDLKVTDQVELRLVLHVQPPTTKDGPVVATFDSPNQAAKGLKVDSVTFENGEATFTLKDLKAEFKGKLNAKGDAIEGTWSQGGGSLALTMNKAAKAAAPAEIWEGSLQLPNGIELRVVLKISKSKDGKLKALFDSPDQNASDIKVDEVSLDKKTLKFTMKALKAEYTGTLNAAGDEATGTFTQNGAEIDLTLKKVVKVTELRRTQNPKPPFPYDSEFVTYENKQAGVKLAGTLTKPRGDGPFPAVILITGSGAQDRDESLLGHKPFLVLADHLTRAGIAVLRVDDRGVGGSTGNSASATSEDFAGDVREGVNYLRSRGDIDKKKIGLCGHSEGGLIAPMVAVNSDDVAFIVLMAGPGLPGDQILKMQGALIFKALGSSDEKIERIAQIQDKYFALIRSEKDVKVLREKLKAVTKELEASLPEDERKTLIGGSSDDDSGYEAITSPWMRYFLTYDPRPTLAKVKCPVLAINGEKDLQVPSKQDLAEIEKAVRSGGNSRITTREFKDLNHLFQTSTTGAPSEYGRIEETIAPVVLEAIATWIKEQTGTK